MSSPESFVSVLADRQRSFGRWGKEKVEPGVLHSCEDFQTAATDHAREYSSIWIVAVVVNVIAVVVVVVVVDAVVLSLPILLFPFLLLPVLFLLLFRSPARTHGFTT